MPGRPLPGPSCDLLVLGELNADVVADCGDTLPAFGQAEQLLDRAALTLGSSGAITASAAAALGLRVAFAGVVGDDPLGTFVLDELAARGVDVSACRRLPGRATGMTVVLNRTGGDRALLTFPGTIPDLAVADVPGHLLDGARHVHVSSYYLQDALRPGLPALFATLAARGATTSLDPGWDPSGTWDHGLADALRAVRWLLPNDQELRHIAAAQTGTPGTADPDALLRAVTALGPGIAAKLGATGAAVLDRPATAGGTGAAGRVTVTPVTPVDTTGAGDNFNAGFIAGLLDGADPHDALARAAACGSVSVLGFGGTGRHAGPAEAAALAADLPRTPLR
ncbi:carbohydrate kinase family protein [Kitasatospora sp. NE20-6]|uniref:carbohydrate kinase family protein n=1 Tax=Kitasatospora sp. NE20-6 TaxID=2859066 RepID=UPI0038B3455B